MSPGKRIFLNVAATYGRSLYALVVGLFCARWVLMSLGEVDFGLFGVIGGLISICAVFNALLTSATTRFFALFCGLVFIVPLLVGIDKILALWLKTPPPFSSLLCTLFLIAFIVDMLGCGHDLAINASGRIAKYQPCLGLSWMLTLPIAFLLMRIGVGVASIGWALIAGFAFSSAVRIGFARRIIGMSIGKTMMDSLKVCGCGVSSIGVGMFMRLRMPDEWVWVFLAMGVAALLFSITFFLLVLSKGERQSVMEKAWGKFR